MSSRKGRRGQRRHKKNGATRVDPTVVPELTLDEMIAMDFPEESEERVRFLGDLVQVLIGPGFGVLLWTATRVGDPEYGASGGVCLYPDGAPGGDPSRPWILWNCADAFDGDDETYGDIQKAMIDVIHMVLERAGFAVQLSSFRDEDGIDEPLLIILGGPEPETFLEDAEAAINELA